MCYKVYFTGVNFLVHHICDKRFGGIYVELITIVDQY